MYALYVASVYVENLILGEIEVYFYFFDIRFKNAKHFQAYQQAMAHSLLLMPESKKEKLYIYFCVFFYKVFVFIFFFTRIIFPYINIIHKQGHVF